LDQAIRKSRRQKHKFALLFIDLDDFKDVNDSYGHVTGDEVLQKVVANMVLSFPVEAAVESRYLQTVENGEKWETLATISINEPGSYSVIFELWIYDVTAGLKFSHNYCVLNIEVVDQV